MWMSVRFGGWFGRASHARDPASRLGVSGQAGDSTGIPWGHACQEVS